MSTPIPITYKSSYIDKTYKGIIIKKGWGTEELIYNSNLYCGKILYFNNGCKFSNHLHVNKIETWRVLSGEYKLIITNPKDAKKIELSFKEGDCYHVPNGLPHQIKCIKAGSIMEVSTMDDSNDSIRIEPGDSQK